MIDVTFRQMLPQEEILKLVNEEVAELGRYTEPVKCRVVIQSKGDIGYDASVVVGSVSLSSLRTLAHHQAPDLAVRSAFAQLRRHVQSSNVTGIAVGFN